MLSSVLPAEYVRALVAITNIIALAATAGAPVVAVVAIRSNASLARGLARSGRRYDTRAKVYEELLHYMHHSMLRLDRIEPILRTVPPGPEPPDPIPIEQALQVQVRASIFGSVEVQKVAEEFMRKVRGFDYATSMRNNDQLAGNDPRESIAEMNKYRQ
ncbi:MAG TPA: hypothetical protein VIM23_03170 [Gaiellaceae bacterium]